MKSMDGWEYMIYVKLNLLIKTKSYFHREESRRQAEGTEKWLD